MIKDFVRELFSGLLFIMCIPFVLAMVVYDYFLFKSFEEEARESYEDRVL